MQTSQTEDRRPERFAAYIAARRFDPPRPLLIKAAGLAEPKGHALDAGAGALNATKYLLSAGFKHVTAFDSSPASQQVAEELPADQASFVLARFENFTYPESAYDLVNAEFSLPFTDAHSFPLVLTKLLASVKPGGLFTGQLFGPNDSWNVPESGMNFHSRRDVEQLLRGWATLELTEEDHPGKTKLGEDKHWHIFHIIARRARRSGDNLGRARSRETPLKRARRYLRSVLRVIPRGIAQNEDLAGHCHAGGECNDW